MLCSLPSPTPVSSPQQRAWAAPGSMAQSFGTWIFSRQLTSVWRLMSRRMLLLTSCWHLRRLLKLLMLPNTTPCRWEFATWRCLATMVLWMAFFVPSLPTQMLNSATLSHPQAPCPKALCPYIWHLRNSQLPWTWASKMAKLPLPSHPKRPKTYSTSLASRRDWTRVYAASPSTDSLRWSTLSVSSIKITISKMMQSWRASSCSEVPYLQPQSEKLPRLLCISCLSSINQ